MTRLLRTGQDLQSVSLGRDTQRVRSETHFCILFRSSKSCIVAISFGATTYWNIIVRYEATLSRVLAFFLFFFFMLWEANPCKTLLLLWNALALEELVPFSRN